MKAPTLTFGIGVFFGQNLMKKPQQQFTKQTDFYKKYRPSYPEALLTDILALTQGRECCWDCGTGNGQVAIVLAKHFRTVEATDISKNQLAKAVKAPNIRYSQQRAEATDFEENTFDLITVAQAAHWFDMDAFNQEFKRVAKPQALVALWGYDLVQVDRNVDALMQRFYSEIVGPFWRPERRHIDQEYRNIRFNFQEITLPGSYAIEAQWELETMEGYLNSWSSVQNFKEARGENPVNPFITQLKAHWGKGAIKKVRFPIFTRIGKVSK
ncbi:class I SAM-dependent methyltransferase [Flavobacteriaceae bacterium 3-367]|uniref:class I SAM-dependent methyltransferase n=1 Tax=Eudoraea algarum TaxID=3417568 RepID=UPI00328BDE3D